MVVAHSLIPGLEEIVRSGDSKRRGDAVRKISDLFLLGASRFQQAHIELFDGILTSLVPQTETEARGELAERLSALINAPPQLVAMLVRDDSIEIAGPLLRRSPVVDEATLVELAKLKGQPHLLAISSRSAVSPPITDVIVRRGDREVVRRIASNAGANFSHLGYAGLIRRAGDDGVLAMAVGQRGDLAPPQLKDLLARSVEVVRRRLFDAATPEQRAAINRVMAEITGTPKHLSITRDFATAQRTVQKLHQADDLNEGTLLRFARAHQYEETAAALAAMSGVRIATIDQLLKGDRDDPILILGKSIGISWATVRALMVLRLGPGRSPAAADVEEARQNFERLVPATAQRVLTFWQTREPTSAMPL
ncbi:MAG: hypothetical protein JWR89_2200 [Tardiphaga sp.]|jgi:uncharacterized protein (DUF2336 family)|uniref:DUF2336 domain-containing protein n=1 Tax=Tardiphaga sp. TaxID=1926292 RepID=UPI002633E0A8|nr:DUF2336 domain-containing protein [Tardiphaga sp.]MDB5502298.1 hypothetical protein [Tardiphaga sp.]